MRKIIDGHTGLMALLGSPVAHSISPMMHNMAFEELGLNNIYVCFDVKEQELETAVAGLKAAGICGFNVTMPDKNKMTELVDELSPAARLIGAVNTVVNREGYLIGHNTDGVGYMRSVQDAGYDAIGQEMTLMGAGGAATAICVQAALDGVKKLNLFARSTSRFHERTVKLVENIRKTTKCQITLYDQQDTGALRTCLAESAILVNATSVGMAPKIDASIIPDVSMFRPELIVSDIIYNPKETKLLRQAREAGCRTFNGMYMLLYQGEEAFRLWTGQDMPVAVIKEKLF
ncbi:MAG: shikimate dehydrogenase [Lachnospiraceae bacterium]|nr:shikimate dehydrogenase [Lachnospiraceae bacterium]